MLKDASQGFLKSKPSELKRLGIDEIAWVKGKGNYCAVLIDLDLAKPIAILNARTQSHVREVLTQWGIEILEQIEEVSIDLWKPYKNLVEEFMPSAQIVADRFHPTFRTHNCHMDKIYPEVIASAPTSCSFEK